MSLIRIDYSTWMRLTATNSHELPQYTAKIRLFRDQYLNKIHLQLSISYLMTTVRMAL